MAIIEITPTTDTTVALHFDEYMEMCGDSRRWNTIQKDQKSELLSMLFEGIIERIGDTDGENLFESLGDADLLDFS